MARAKLLPCGCKQRLEVDPDGYTVDVVYIEKGCHTHDVPDDAWVTDEDHIRTKEPR